MTTDLLNPLLDEYRAEVPAKERNETAFLSGIAALACDLAGHPEAEWGDRLDSLMLHVARFSCEECPYPQACPELGCYHKAERPNRKTEKPAPPDDPEGLAASITSLVSAGLVRIDGNRVVLTQAGRVACISTDHTYGTPC